MMRGASVILLLAACQPLGDATGELAAVGDSKRVYLDMKLAEARVMQDIRVGEGRLKLGTDKTMPAKIYALSYDGHEAPDLQLSGEKVNFNHLITFTNVVLAWNYEKSASPVYTCHLHEVSLGEQRDIIKKNSDAAPFCFVEEADTGDTQTPVPEREGDYVRRLADYCLTASGNGSRFIFLEGKDFACDLSEKGDGSLVLQASCLAKVAKGDKNCLAGKVRACAVSGVGFENFVEIFKQRVDTTGCKEDSCQPIYAFKEDKVPPVEDPIEAATPDDVPCPDFFAPSTEASDKEEEGGS